MRSNPAVENLVLAFFSTLLGKDTGSVIFSILSLATSQIHGFKSFLLLRKETHKKVTNC